MKRTNCNGKMCSFSLEHLPLATALPLSSKTHSKKRSRACGDRDNATSAAISQPQRRTKSTDLVNDEERRFLEEEEVLPVTGL